MTQELEIKIEQFHKDCRTLALINNYHDVDTVKKEYQFYTQIGYTHAQSLMLSVCNFNTPHSAWNQFFIKIDEMRKQKLTEWTLCDFVVEYIHELAVAREKEIEELRRKEAERLLAEQSQQQPRLGDMPDRNGKFDLFSVFRGAPAPKDKATKGAIYGGKKTKCMQESSFDMEEGMCEFSVAPLAAPAIMSERKVSYQSAIPPRPMMPQPPMPMMADTESYETIEEKGFQTVAANPTSSFRTTCNTASMGTLLNQLRHKKAVKPNSIRMEELMNFLDYDLGGNDDIFNINIEMCDKPYSKNKLLFIGFKGKVIKPEKQNIVLLLDTSGSMAPNNANMLRVIATVMKKLNTGDVLSLITYSDEDHTIWDSVVIEDNLDSLIRDLFGIYITGCTNGSAGIETAYKIAAKNYQPEGANKVILITDGDLNFGINSKDGLKNLILEKKKTGVFLSVIGMGINNYKDDKLEVLSKNGNGNYCVINSDYEVTTNIIEKYPQLIFSIAKDVKAQVEFNPALVKSYRLLGYENRTISHSDFNNDEVIAEPFGSGATCIAMYEVELVDGAIENAGLKYQKPELTDSKEYCTVALRYKLPLEEKSELITKPCDHIGEMSDNVKLAYICYAIAEKMRESSFATLKDELYARWLVETTSGHVFNELNGDKIDMLKFLIQS